MREEYDYLTDQTRDTLTDNAVKRVAMGWLKAGETIYQILRGEKQDPYAYFRSFYEGLCKGHVPTKEYDQDLAYLREKYDDSKDDRHSTHEAFRLKNHAYSGMLETYLKAAADGHIDLQETEELLGLIAIEKPLIEALERSLLANKAKLENSASGGFAVVSGQRGR